MKIFTHLTLLISFSICLFGQAQTAKSKRDQSINEARAKNLVEKFDSTVLVSQQDRQALQDKIRVRRQAILATIENAEIKDKKRAKLLKELDKAKISKPLIDFIALHQNDINQFIKAFNTGK